MTDIGEAIVAAYLREICNCDFIDKNVKINIQGVLGEIDVVGVNSEEKHIYIAEVAIHTAGLQYINQREGTIDNRDRLIKKFDKAIRYANDKYKGYKKTFMFWSPVVRPTKTESGQKKLTDINEISTTIKKQFNVVIQFFVNEDFLSAIDNLRAVAGNSKGNLTDPILRLYQIEEISRGKFGSKPSQKSTVTNISRTGKQWNPKAGTIGAIVKQYLESHEDPIYEEIRQIVLSQFPDSAFNKNHLSWYKNHTANIVKTVNGDKDAKPSVRRGAIKVAMVEYLSSHPNPKCNEMEKIALKIKPDSAFNDNHYKWYINFFNKSRNL